MNPWSLLLPLGALLLAFGALLLGMSALRRARLIQNLPTSKTRGVFLGLVELEGEVQSDAPHVAHLSGLPCVHHRWTVSEHWRRTVVETVRDPKGGTRTRMRTEEGWKEVASGGNSQPFYLVDDEGAVLVRPDGAAIESESLHGETATRDDAIYYGKGPPEAVSNSTGQRRFDEHGLVLGARIYVLGRAGLCDDVVAPEIKKVAGEGPFVISTRGQARVLRGRRWATAGWAALGLGLALLAPVLRGAALDSPPPPQHFVAVGLVFVLVWCAAYVWNAANDLIDLKHRVERGRAEVDVQLRRRHDLIPALERLLRAAAVHERETQAALANLRAEDGASGGSARAAVPTLVALEERYPELLMDRAFAEMHRQLVDTEQRIALARDYHNGIATQFATRLETVPDRFLGALLGLRRVAPIAAQGFERAPQPVHLGTDVPAAPVAP
ncbi:MAG: LemA domain-containing protein [Planctomycetaceae bacterium]|nr:LemA domain-containing protein [Planctomycetaceae bacterium]